MDDRLRLKVKAIVQFSHTDRERTLALYAFVKRMPWGRFGRIRFPTARQVLDRGEGDSYAKSTLLVAMLRLAGIPARLRMLQLRGAVMRGLCDGLGHSFHPLLECWVDGRWSRTDTHIYDAPYAAAAQILLRAKGWRRGYGLEQNGQQIWGASGEAFAAFDPNSRRGTPMGDLGVFNDPFEFVTGGAGSRSAGAMIKSLAWSRVAMQINQGIAQVRSTIHVGADASGQGDLAQ